MGLGLGLGLGLGFGFGSGLRLGLVSWRGIPGGSESSMLNASSSRSVAWSKSVRIGSDSPSSPTCLGLGVKG